MNNQNQSNRETSPRSIRNILDELRVNLKTPAKEKTADWEALTAKLTNLAFVDYLNQEDNKLAIETIALIGHAKKNGPKSAKKIAVPFGRWKKDAPPSLSSTNIEEEEKYSAIKLMTTINADWVANYAIEELLNAQSESLQKELINWGLNNSKNIATYFEIFASKFNPESHSISSFIAVLRWSIKKSCFSHKLTALSPFPFIHKSISSSLSYINNTKVNELGVKKPQIMIASLQEASCDFINETTSINPTYLLSPTIANTLNLLAAESKSWPKSTNIKISVISQRLVNLLSIQLPLLNTDTVNALVPTLLTYKKSLPDLNKYFKQTFEHDIDAINFSNEKNNSKNIEYPLEESLLSLLPNWKTFLEKNTNNPEIAQIDFKIKEIAEIIGITELGVVGEIVEYNPLRHKTINPDSPIPINVKIIKTGLAVANKDGLSRVVLKSLVEEVH